MILERRGTTPTQEERSSRESLDHLFKIQSEPLRITVCALTTGRKYRLTKGYACI